MSAINSSQSSLLNAVISGYQTNRDINMAIIGKTKDAHKAEGTGELTLIEGVITPADGSDTPTMGALASGLGQKVDLSA